MEESADLFTAGVKENVVRKLGEFSDKIDAKARQGHSNPYLADVEVAIKNAYHLGLLESCKPLQSFMEASSDMFSMYGFTQLVSVLVGKEYTFGDGYYAEVCRDLCKLLLDSPASSSSPTTKLTNEERDKYIYEQRMLNPRPSMAEIRRKIGQNPDWEPCNSDQSAHSAAKRYAHRKGLPPLPSREQPQ